MINRKIENAINVKFTKIGRKKIVHRVVKCNTKRGLGEGGWKEIELLIKKIATLYGNTAHVSLNE